MEAAGREIGLPVRGVKTGGGSDGNHTCRVAPTIDGLGRTKMVALFLERWAAEFAIA